MYQALYRKWRPQSFSDVVGQPAITETIKTQVESGRLSHAYIFAGSRGTGKTTCAKILAKAANCENPIHGNPCNECASCRGISQDSITDVVEIDAASNNGVDYVRDLRDEAIYSPATAKKRVYIIDEVHMFSNSAFNALLKILEEPPEHVIFILATTELHKVPATILSRCQRFTFKRITAEDICERILFIARSENVSIDGEAAEFIARLADGGMRDALSIFDQCVSYGEKNITMDTVQDVVGLAGSSAILSLIDAIYTHDVKTALIILSDIYNAGRDLVSVLGELSGYLRDLLVCKTAPNSEITRVNSIHDEKTFKKQLDAFDVKWLIFLIEGIQDTLTKMGASTNKRIHAELCIIKLCIGEVMQTIVSETKTSMATQRENFDNSKDCSIKRQNNHPQPVVNPVDRVDNLPNTSENEDAHAHLDGPSMVDSTKICTQWTKIIETARHELSPGDFFVIKSLKPVEKENLIQIFTDNEFTYNTLNKRQILDTLERATEAVLGRKITIKILNKQENVAEDAAIEDLCSKIENMPNVTIIS